MVATEVNVVELRLKWQPCGESYGCSQVPVLLPGSRMEGTPRLRQAETFLVKCCYTSVHHHLVLTASVLVLESSQQPLQNDERRVERLQHHGLIYVNFALTDALYFLYSSSPFAFLILSH